MSKRFLLIPFLIFPLFSQLDYSGYFESELDVVDLKTSYYYGYNKLRIDLENSFEIGSLYGSIIGFQYWGKSNFLISDFIDLEIQDEQSFSFGDTLYLDNLFLDLFTEFGEFIIGRQPLSVGVGYVWNPMDIFNQKDILDPSYELGASDAFRWMFNTSLITTDLILSPSDHGHRLDIYSSIKGTLGRFDITGSAFQYSVQDISFLENEEISGIGFACTGEVVVVGLWTEYTQNDNKSLHYSFNEWVAGLDYTTTNSMYFLIERYHNDDGASWENGYSDESLILYMQGQVRSLSRNYLMVHTSYPFNHWATCSSSYLKNLEDDSKILSIQVGLSILENLDILSTFYLFDGVTHSEFGIQESALSIRMNIYF